MTDANTNVNAGTSPSDLADVYAKRLAESADVEFLRRFYAQSVYEDVQENWSWKELIDELNNLDEVDDLKNAYQG